MGLAQKARAVGLAVPKAGLSRVFAQSRLAMDESTGGNDREWMCVVAGGVEGARAGDEEAGGQDGDGGGDGLDGMEWW